MLYSISSNINTRFLHQLPATHIIKILIKNVDNKIIKTLVFLLKCKLSKIEFKNLLRS